jgi:8-oxo-dGTP diphosphatase
VSDKELVVATPRVAAGVIFTDAASRVLMVRPTYKDYWDIPGGYVEPGESPHDAAAREVKEELGLTLDVGRMLAVDWAPSDKEGDKLLFLFAGPPLPDDVAFRFADGEIARTEYVPVDELESYTIERLARRIRSAVLATQPEYLEHGQPAAG